MITQRQREVLERLRRDSDFQHFVEHLIETREEKREELEASNDASRSHKLSGYVLALSDLIKLCSSERR